MIYDHIPLFLLMPILHSLGGEQEQKVGRYTRKYREVKTGYSMTTASCFIFNIFYLYDMTDAIHGNGHLTIIERKGWERVTYVYTPMFSHICLLTSFIPLQNIPGSFHLLQSE